MQRVKFRTEYQRHPPHISIVLALFDQGGCQEAGKFSIFQHVHEFLLRDFIIVVQIQYCHDFVGQIGHAVYFAIDAVQYKECMNDLIDLVVIDLSITVAIVCIVEPFEFLTCRTCIAVDIDGNEILVELYKAILGDAIERTEHEFTVAGRRVRLKQFLVEVDEFTFGQATGIATALKLAMVMQDLVARKFRSFHQVVDAIRCEFTAR